MLICSCSSSATPNTSLCHALEIDRRVHGRHHQMAEFHDYPHQTPFEISLLQAWRLSDLALHYTPVTSGNENMRQALGLGQLQHHTSQLRLWPPGVAHSRLQRFHLRAMSRHIALVALSARNRTRCRERVQSRSHRQARSPSCRLRAR